jgi:hypothetical protein
VALQRQLATDGRAGRARRLREDGEHGVPFGADFSATVSRDLPPQDEAVRILEDGLRPGPHALDHRGGALDVAEQKGQHAGWRLVRLHDGVARVDTIIAS